jgi:hypothetical protein
MVPAMESKPLRFNVQHSMLENIVKLVQTPMVDDQTKHNACSFSTSFNHLPSFVQLLLRNVSPFLTFLMDIISYPFEYQSQQDI